MTGSVGVMLFLWHKQPATESDATLRHDTLGLPGTKECHMSVFRAYAWRSGYSLLLHEWFT